MSAYNTVVLPTEETCPNCGSAIRRRVQFKYGDTWQHDYAVGDRIVWGGNDVGKPAKLVKALGYPEDCPVCGYDLGGVFDVIVRDGIIEDVVPGSTQPYIDADNASYIVVEE
jgi:hypothetical protein